MAPPSQSDMVVIDYTNWRGERGTRMIQPTRIWYGESEWHDGVQWFLDAEDVVKMQTRSFAMRDIHGWRDA